MPEKTMIDCRFSIDNHRLAAFELSGHAGFADAGQDIVCAAVSAACDLTMHMAETYFDVKVRISTSGGTVSFKALNEADATDKLLRGFSDYLESIVKAYPECIRIEYLEV